jgi:hypothetical protein
MSSDPWQFSTTGLDSPAVNAASAVGTAVGTAAITLSPASRGLYVGGAGNIVATMYGGNTVTFSSVPAGTILPIRVATIGTATTATQIISLF